MANVDARVITVIGAIRAGIQTLNEPGLSVNQHPNPFFISVIGSLNLEHIAQRVLQHLDAMPKEAPAAAPKSMDDL